MGNILNWIDRISRSIAWFAMLLIVCLIATMFFEVIARYGFNAPTIWSYDISYMLNGTIFLLGSGYVLSKNLHVRVDFLSTRMPVTVQHTVNLLFDLFVLLPAIAWITYRATGKAWRSFDSGAVEVVSPWAPVIWPFEAGIALGLLGLTLQLLATIVRHAIGMSNPDAVPGPAENESH